MKKYLLYQVLHVFIRFEKDYFFRFLENFNIIFLKALKVMQFTLEYNITFHIVHEVMKFR